MKRFQSYVCAICLLLAGFSAQARARALGRRDVIKGPMTVRVIRVIDGDTVVVRAHVWIGQDIDTSVRLDGMDAPEMHAHCTSERAMAQSAKNAVVGLLRNNRMVISDIRLDKYAGRVLAHAETTGGLDIGRTMIAKGLARPYYGGHRGPWCTPEGVYNP
ncbi:MAG: thermonuclease family protein [Alphaproteobacteria bacterium]|nr:thermonuclease family protein [Alphaproteobacteria bacterium]MDE2336356.1 thermonuclease family protein [Alphaproteobacteria bacterium]